MLSHRLPLILAFLLLIETGIAHSAEEKPDYAYSGPYLHAAVIQGFEHFDGSPEDIRVGFDLRMGARFWRYAAAEIEFQAVPNWEIDGFERSSYGITANAKGYYPMGRFQPFLLAGLGTLITEPDPRQGEKNDARFAGRVGAGVDIFVWRRAIVSVSYGYTGNFTDFGYSAVYWGIGWHFEGD